MVFIVFIAAVLVFISGLLTFLLVVEGTGTVVQRWSACGLLVVFSVLAVDFFIFFVQLLLGD